MSGALTVERAEEMVREIVEALLAIVNDPNVPISERIAAAQEADRHLSALTRPAPQVMPSSFPGSPP